MEAGWSISILQKFDMPMVFTMCMVTYIMARLAIHIQSSQEAFPNWKPVLLEMPILPRTPWISNRTDENWYALCNLGPPSVKTMVRSADYLWHLLMLGVRQNNPTIQIIYILPLHTRNCFKSLMPGSEVKIRAIKIYTERQRKLSLLQSNTQ